MKKKIYKHSLSESQIQTKFIKGLKSRNPDAFIVKLSDKWVSGIPDVLMIKNAKAFFYEIKSESGIVSKIQNQTHEAIQKAGGFIQIIKGGDNN